MSKVAASSRLRLHALTMVPEGAGVMIGRPAIGSYALFPPEGAEILRQLEAGATIGEITSWYERYYGASLDVEDYVETLTDLQFIATDIENLGAAAATKPVRWQRLGHAVFSAQAWFAYAVVAVGAATLMMRNPELRPSYRNLFFTTHISLIPLALMGGTIPTILIHESFHALAGRRLGLPSQLRIGRRLVYLVAETRLDALFSVPRSKRYLPFLAGMVADVVIVSALTVTAALLDELGAARWTSGLLLAIAFTGVLRLLWQFLFYLETDLYFVGATLLGCANLQSATRHFIASRTRRLFGRASQTGQDDFTDSELRVARWYAPILISGYAFSLGTFLWAGLPTAVRIWSMAVDRLVGHASVTATVDALAFLLIEAIPMGLLGYLAVRDFLTRRRRADTT